MLKKVLIAKDITKNFTIDAVLKEKYPLDLTSNRKKYILENIIQHVQNPDKKAFYYIIYFFYIIIIVVIKITPDFCHKYRNDMQFPSFWVKIFFFNFLKNMILQFGPFLLSMPHF